MIVVMEEGANEDQISRVVEKLIQLGFDIHRSTGTHHTVLGAVGGKMADPRELELLDGVKEVVRISSPYKLASRTFKPDDTVIKIKDVEIGGKNVVMMAGPCTIESREQVDSIAEVVAKQGVHIMRGGAFKPRTSPYSFQGIGEDGL